MGSVLSQRRHVLVVGCLVVSLSLLLYPQEQLQVGYIVLTADSGTALPVGSTLFSYTNAKGILVSQAGVAAVQPFSTGRIFVDQAGARTGIALVNSSASSTSVQLTLRDEFGREVGHRVEMLAAGRHFPKFVDELFSNLPAGFTGSLTFTSAQKLGAITLRESRNAYPDERLYTTLPVVELGRPDTTQPLVFPQIAAGDAYRTQLVLINPTARRITGQMRFVGKEGNPLSLQLVGSTAGAQFPYQIEAQGVFRAEFDRAAGLGAGYAVITPDADSVTPSGTAIFQLKENGVLVTEAGVGAASLTTTTRIFVDHVGSSTGVAVANPNSQVAQVTFRLLDRQGQLLQSTTRNLLAQGHMALFEEELFQDLTSTTTFTGLIEISSAIPVAAITLKFTINSRREAVMTTLPVADTIQTSKGGLLVFPHLAVGGGYSTRLILINPDADGKAGGMLNICQSDGGPMIVPLGSKTSSQFSYELAAGGGRQLFPGHTATIAGIYLVDPSSYRQSGEVVVNEGRSIGVPVLVLDTAGQVRDEFELKYSSLSTDLATVDSAGIITGKKAGFSTLTMTSGGVIAIGTITVVVVKVQSGAGGIKSQGVAQDLGQRLYLANAEQHTILLAADMKQAPAIYAGVAKTPGLKNDVRLQSWFKNPSFLALDQAEGKLYISDRDNHVIRKVGPGPAEKVETLAGSGVPGSRDGTGQEAAFNLPQGVALDNRGNLWIADSGNHTIRRIRLETGKVETIAGKAGSGGFADGQGALARFNLPTGIAWERESVAQELARIMNNQPPPPVSVLVADTGNGCIRRVYENGEVETIRSPGPGATSVKEAITSSISQLAGTPLQFSAPAGIAVDSLGNIYVTEPGLNRLRTILQNGAIITASQAGTLNVPQGLAITQSGKVIVADSSNLACEINYGKPEIAGISPEKVSNRGGEKVTVKGVNFSPESRVVVAGAVIQDRQVIDAQTITFAIPAFSSGLVTLTVQSRGGLAQKPLLIEPVPLKDLPVGAITTVAGGWNYNMGDGLPAMEAPLQQPGQIVLDASGNLFIADTDHHRVRRVDAATGTITTVAGTGEEPDPDVPQPDGIPALTFKLAGPSGLAIDPSGDLLVADSGISKIVRISSSTGIATIIAGKGDKGLGDDGPALNAGLNSPKWLAVDKQGNIFISDSGHDRIRKIDAQTGIIRTVAGNGDIQFSGDNGPATRAGLNGPEGIAVDGPGNLFIAERGFKTGMIYGIFGQHKFEPRIRKVDAKAGIISTIAGTGTEGYSGDGGPAIAAKLYGPTGITLDSNGNLFISDSSNHRVRKVEASSGVITTIGGWGDCDQKFDGDGISAHSARICSPSGIAADSSGNVFLAERKLPPTGTQPPDDPTPGLVRRIDAVTGLISTVAGSRTYFTSFSSQEVPALEATLGFLPAGLCFDPLGNLFFADSVGCVRRISATNGKVKTVNHPTTGAERVTGVVTDSKGNIFFARDTLQIFKHDMQSREVAEFYRMEGWLYGINVDSTDNLLVASVENASYPRGIIGKIDATGSSFVTVAGGGDKYPGDDGRATQAWLKSPTGVAVDQTGNIIIADAWDHRIRKVDAKSGIITTIAGTGEAGYSGDGGPAKQARLNGPENLVLDGAGNIFVAEKNNFVVRKIAAATGIITTVAGNGKAPTTLGDNQLATDVGLAFDCIEHTCLLTPPGVLHFYVGMAFDRDGNLYFTDYYHGRIRAIRGVGQPASGR